MTDKQPEALLALADRIEEAAGAPINIDPRAAAELRRLYASEREGWRYADELEQERQRLTAINAQLLEFVQSLIDDYHSDEGFPEARYVVYAARAAIAAAAEREALATDIHSCHPDCERPACVQTRAAVAAEREACAQLCEKQQSIAWVKTSMPALIKHEPANLMAKKCAAVIRARGDA